MTNISMPSLESVESARDVQFLPLGFTSTMFGGETPREDFQVRDSTSDFASKEAKSYSATPE